MIQNMALSFFGFRSNLFFLSEKQPYHWYAKFILSGFHNVKTCTHKTYNSKPMLILHFKFSSSMGRHLGCNLGRLAHHNKSPTQCRLHLFLNVQQLALPATSLYVGLHRCCCSITTSAINTFLSLIALSSVVEK